MPSTNYERKKEKSLAPSKCLTASAIVATANQPSNQPVDLGFDNDNTAAQHRLCGTANYDDDDDGKLGHSNASRTRHISASVIEHFGGTQQPTR